MKKIIIILITSSIFLFMQRAADAEMYKWVDENGQMHFSNIPPKNVPPSGDMEEIHPQGSVTIMGTEQQDVEPSRKMQSILDHFKPKPKKQNEHESQHRIELYSTTW